jgi:hypothetical protein
VGGDGLKPGAGAGEGAAVLVFELRAHDERAALGLGELPAFDVGDPDGPSLRPGAAAVSGFVGGLPAALGKGYGALWRGIGNVLGRLPRDACLGWHKLGFEEVNPKLVDQTGWSLFGRYRIHAPQKVR